MYVQFPFTLSFRNLRTILFAEIYETFSIKSKNVCNVILTIIRLNIRHPSLESAIWYEFTQSKHLNEVKILNKIEAVQQSKKEFTITDGSAQFELLHVKYPQGS